MRKYYIILGALLVGAGALVGGQQYRERPKQTPRLEGFPSRIASQINAAGRLRYMWISESEFVDQYGFIRDDLLDAAGMSDRDEVPARHEAALAAFNAGSEPPPCDPITMYPGSGPSNAALPAANLNTLVERAAAVFVGTVVEKEGGFSEGRPGEMLRVAVDEWLGGSEEFPRRSDVLVFYPGGEVSIGLATYCVARAGFPPSPAVGDRILLFPSKNYVGPEFPFIAFDSGPNSAGLYWDEEVGALRASSSLFQYIPSLSRSQSLDALRDQMQVAVARSGLQ